MLNAAELNQTNPATPPVKPAADKPRETVFVSKNKDGSYSAQLRVDGALQSGKVKSGLTKAQAEALTAADFGNRPAAKIVKTKSSKTSAYAGKSIKLLVKDNPKRGKSRDRFQLYFTTTSVNDLLAKGLFAGDLAWDLERKFIEIV